MLGQRMICQAFEKLQVAGNQPMPAVPVSLRASGSVPVEFWAQRFDAIESKVDGILKVISGA